MFSLCFSAFYKKKFHCKVITVSHYTQTFGKLGNSNFPPSPFPTLSHLLTLYTTTQCHAAVHVQDLLARCTAAAPAAFCDLAEEYADHCRRVAGLCLPWRAVLSDLCPPPACASPDAHYEECGYGCGDPTCQTAVAANGDAASAECLRPQVPGCYCNEGWVRGNSTTCVCVCVDTTVLSFN